MIANKRGVWYHVTIYECPLCCHADTYRERREGPKPKDPRDRYEWRTSACGHHFL